MKVFRMNEYDWVASESESEAIEFYLETTGADKEEVEDIEECSMEETMLFDLGVLKKDKRESVRKEAIEEKDGMVKLTFKRVIELLGKMGCQPENHPYIIASTEY